MKIKILVIGVSNVIGGIEIIVLNLYRNINKSKFQIDFLSNCELLFEDELVNNGSNIFRYTRRGKNPIKFCSDLKSFFKNHNEYDFVWIHQSRADRITAHKFIKKYTNAKIINHCHTTSYFDRDKAVYNFFIKLLIKLNKKKFLKLTDYMFACSREAGVDLYGSENADKIFVLNNGINPNDFAFYPDARIRQREKLNLADKFVIGHIGRLTEQKNHAFLIDIFNEIHKRNSDSVLLLAGDGELRREIEKKVSLLGLKSSVMLMGSRSDISELLSAMDVFLLPSLNEGLGIVLIEAQANGLQCVASDVVPKESKVTNLIEYTSLKKPATYWADCVLKFQNNYERKNMADEIRRAGFDIKEVAAEFEKFCTERL